MIFFSILLIVTIFKSKARLTDSLSKNRYFRKDVKLSFSLLAMNLLFIILDLPDEIDIFLSVLFYIFFNCKYLYFNCFYFKVG